MTASPRRSATRRSAARRTTRRRCTCSRRCAISATPRVRFPRPSRPRARTSACRSGPASPKSSRPKSPTSCGARSGSSPADAPSGQPAPGLAARHRRGPDRRGLAAHVLPALRQGDAGLLPPPARLAGARLRRRAQADDVRAVRLLRALVAVRLDARHVGRLPRRHRCLGAHVPRAVRVPARAHRRGCRAASRRSTTCSCSPSSPVRACSRGRSSSVRRRASSPAARRCSSSARATPASC